MTDRVYRMDINLTITSEPYSERLTISEQVHVPRQMTLAEAAEILSKFSELARKVAGGAA
ncbi:MAG TPA: hypothetical protein VHA33_29305 [Candidatus Angelobacter sp.]|jgi:hypothetical protein|nr:hypothetical protein [Candidatus Angelobacter sp.]